MNDNFIVHYNHPAWSAETSEDYCPLEGVSGFEVYNHCSEVYAMEGIALHDYHIFLKSGKRAYPVAGDDNHNHSLPRRYKSDSFGGFTMIKAKSLKYEDVIEALENGYVYSSTGPTVDTYTLTGNKLYIHCSPVSRIVLKSARVGVNKQNIISADDTITEAEFDLSTVKGFAYIQIQKNDGSFAVTAPVMEEEWSQ